MKRLQFIFTHRLLEAVIHKDMCFKTNGLVTQLFVASLGEFNVPVLFGGGGWIYCCFVHNIFFKKTATKKKQPPQKTQTKDP